MKNLVAEAVETLRAESIARAEKEANMLIARYVEIMEKAGWDLNVAFPRPISFEREYKAKLANHNFAASLFKWTLACRRPSQPDIRIRCEENEQRFIKISKENASFQYDAFIAKLTNKIGEVDEVELIGSHVWGYSVLKVKKGDVVEKWQTQMIVNQSVNGKLFNQWPTRKIK